MTKFEASRNVCATCMSQSVLHETNTALLSQLPHLQRVGDMRWPYCYRNMEHAAERFVFPYWKHCGALMHLSVKRKPVVSRSTCLSHQE